MSSAPPPAVSSAALRPNSDPRPCIQEIWLGGEPHLVFSSPEGTLTLNRAQARLLRSHQAYLDAFLSTHDAVPRPSAPQSRPVQQPQTASAPRRQGPRSRENYGISRIDQPHKGNHGWYVRVTRGGRTSQKFFADKKYDSRESAFAAAREHRDTIIASLDDPGSPENPPA